MKLRIRPVTPGLWPALEDLFGKPGASNGCWCMYWRIGGRYRERPREENRAALRRIVKRGPPPGLLAFDGDLAVGWCQLTPHDALRWLDRNRSLDRVDDEPVWSISCFYVRRSYRRKGVSTALIEAAVAAARRAGAPAVEAYPSEASGAFTGYASAFARLGFAEVGGRLGRRPIMRLRLAPASRTRGRVRRATRGTGAG